MKGSEIALLGGAALLLYFLMKPSAPSAVVVRPLPTPSGSAVLTPGEIAAGAGVVSSLLGDLFGSGSSSSGSSAVYSPSTDTQSG
jgi:hypothetical protein